MNRLAERLTLVLSDGEPCGYCASRTGEEGDVLSHLRTSANLCQLDELRLVAQAVEIRVVHHPLEARDTRLDRFP